MNAKHPIKQSDKTFAQSEELKLHFPNTRGGKYHKCQHRQKKFESK
ncbi:hypothetical protein NPIL_279851, partial [Nephila pilipes]